MPKIRGQKPPGNQRKSVSDAAGNNITDQGDVINAPVKDTEEILSELVPTAADTTRNKKNTIQRERVEPEWQDIFDAADDFIFISDADYKITRGNRALANALKMDHWLLSLENAMSCCTKLMSHLFLALTAKL